MKGKIYAKIKTEKMDVESKNLWTSFDDELMADFRKRMKEGGSDPDNYNFTDPITEPIPAVIQSSIFPMLEPGTCKHFIHNPTDDTRTHKHVCSELKNLTKRCGYNDAKDSKQCALYIDRDAKPIVLEKPNEAHIPEVITQEPKVTKMEDVE